ncbi:MAG: tRNA pseudouridine(55) synthase TruB [Alphaproteobacteria bacterium]|nr:tRNA pseudouridine(55) synthase TruB [Alphaproteobacteria bacterium]
MTDGWICLDKPKGISSNFAMVKVRKLLKEKTGYVGTLDPFATGVLPIAVGRARKFIQFIEDVEKIYEFEVVFGASTDSYDETGKITETTKTIPTQDQIKKILPKFLGEIDQIPPKFSAIKINGRRACDLVRQNKSIEIPSRKVFIHDLKLLQFFENSHAKFQVRCSKGTYVRTLAVDIAQKLGSLCYVKELRRLKSGFFSTERSISLEKLAEIVDTSELDGNLIPLESPLDDIPALFLGKNYISKLQNGLSVQLAESEILSSNIRLFDSESGKFCGICFVSADGMVSAVKMYLNWEIKDVD